MRTIVTCEYAFGYNVNWRGLVETMKLSLSVGMLTVVRLTICAVFVLWLLVSCTEEPKEGNAQRPIDGYLGIEWGTTREFIEATLPWYVSRRYGFTEMENFSGPGARALKYELKVLFAGDERASRAWQVLNKSLQFVFLESPLESPLEFPLSGLLSWNEEDATDAEDSGGSAVWALQAILVDVETDSSANVSEVVSQLEEFYHAEPVQRPGESEWLEAFERGERVYLWFDSEGNSLLVEDDFGEDHVRLRFQSQDYLRWLDELEWEPSGDSEYPSNHVTDVRLSGIYNLEFGMERSEAVRALSNVLQASEPIYESAGETTPGVYTVVYPTILHSWPLLEQEAPESLEGEFALDFLGTGLAQMQVRIPVIDASSELFDELKDQYGCALGLNAPQWSHYRIPRNWRFEEEMEKLVLGDAHSHSENQTLTRSGGYKLDFVMVAWRDQQGNDARLGLRSFLGEDKEITFTVTSEEFRRLQARMSSEPFLDFLERPEEGEDGRDEMDGYPVGERQ